MAGGAVTSQLLVQLIDGVTGPAGKAGAALRGLQGAAAMTGGAIGRAQASIASMMKRQQMAFAAARSELFMSVAAFSMFSAAMYKPVEQALEFEKAMEGIRQKLSATPEYMRNLAEVIGRVREASAQSHEAIVGMVSGLAEARSPLLDQEKVLTMVAKAATTYGGNMEDMWKTAAIATARFKVAPEELGKLFSGLAATGKEGMISFGEMTKVLPRLGALALTYGAKGTNAILDLAAALQIARRGTTDTETAMGNLEGFMTKMTLPRMASRFKKMGINVYAEIDKAVKNKESIPEHMIRLLLEKTGGDPKLLGKFISDKQTAALLRPFFGGGLEEMLRVRADALRRMGELEPDFDGRTLQNVRRCPPPRLGRMGEGVNAHGQ